MLPSSNKKIDVDSKVLDPWFCVLSETAEVVYKTTDYSAPKDDHCILISH